MRYYHFFKRCCLAVGVQGPRPQVGYCSTPGAMACGQGAQAKITNKLLQLKFALGFFDSFSRGEGVNSSKFIFVRGGG